MVGVSTSGHFKDTWGTIDIDEQYSTLSVKQTIVIVFYSNSERREDLLKFNKSLYIYFIQIFEKKEGICIKKYLYRILIRFYLNGEKGEDLLKFNLVIKIFVFEKRSS